MTATNPKSGLTACLRHRDFALLWSGQSLSSIGNFMLPVALAILVLDRGSGVAGLGLVLGTQAAAMLAGGLLAAALGDRWRRTRVMIAADAIRVVGVAGLAAGATTAPDAAVLALVAAVGIGEGLFMPPFSALLPRVLPDDKLPAGNALNQISLQAALMLGPAIAGVLVAVTSPATVLWVDAATFLFSLLTLVAIVEPVPEPASTPPAPGLRGALRQTGTDFRDGIRAVMTRPWISSSIGAATILMTFVVPPAYVVLPVIADERLGGPRAYGLVLAALGLGSVFGSVLAARIRSRRPGVVATVGLLTVVGSVTALALLPLAGVMFFWALAGVGVGIYQVLWLTAIQRDVPDALLGRVMALDWLGTGALMPIGYALTGPIVALLGTKSMLLAGAVLVAVIAPLPLLTRGGPAFATPGQEPVPQPEPMPQAADAEDVAERAAVLEQPRVG